jgi:hypothetical protein
MDPHVVTALCLDPRRYGGGGLATEAMKFQWFLSFLSWSFMARISQARDHENGSCILTSSNEVPNSEICESSTIQSFPISSPLSREKSDSIPNGYHTLVFDDERKYEGNIVNGKFHGQGTYRTKEGIYEGRNLSLSLT